MEQKNPIQDKSPSVSMGVSMLTHFQDTISRWAPPPMTLRIRNAAHSPKQMACADSLMHIKTLTIVCEAFYLTCGGFISLPVGTQLLLSLAKMWAPEGINGRMCPSNS